MLFLFGDDGLRGRRGREEGEENELTSKDLGRQFGQRALASHSGWRGLDVEQWVPPAALAAAQLACPGCVFRGHALESLRTGLDAALI